MIMLKNMRVILKKKKEFLVREKSAHIYPIKISKKQLQAEKKQYQEIINQLVEEINNYSEIIESDTQPKNKLTGYKIHSYNGDELGKVFEKDNEFYRGIYEESVGYFSRLWKTGLIQVLSSYGYLPKTEVTNYYSDEYEMILRHENVEISQSKLWNSEMICDACITMCIVNEVCKVFGYKLIDGHLNNMTFHNGKPMFIDIGSIVEDRGQSTMYERGLVFAGGYQLIFNKLGNSILSRVQTFDEGNNAIWINPMRYDDSTHEYQYFLRKFKKYHRRNSSLCANSIIFKMFECYEVKPEYFSLLFSESKEIEDEKDTFWELHSDDVISIINDLELKNKKFIDVNNGKGYLTKKVYNDCQINIDSVNYDERESIVSYKTIRESKIPVNTFLFHYLYGVDISSATMLKADVAIALDITNNIICYQNWKYDSLFNALSKLAKEYVIISYFPKRNLSRCKENLNETYGLFERKFKLYFELLYDCSVNYENYQGKIYVGKIRRAL